MELTSSSTSSKVSEKWKLCAVGGFMGFFVISLFLTSNPQAVDLWVASTRSSTNFFISSYSSSNSPAPETSSKDSGQLPPIGGVEKKECNMFEGRWVYRPNVSPSYKVEQCPFLEEKMSCRRNGRPDSDYEGWSWEAADCDIPLFNGRDMLERLRGKRVILAGDSLNRNQWESLACLIYTSVSDPSRASVDAEGATYRVIKALDYNFTLEFYWSPFLVYLDENENENDKTSTGGGRKVLHLDKLVPAADQWRGADVMVFNSGHWWTHSRKFRVYDAFEYQGETSEVMEIEVAYKRALTTWSDWLTSNVDPNKTSVFFRSISPEHKGKQWCFNATRPLDDLSSFFSTFPRSMVDVVETHLAELASNNNNNKNKNKNNNNNNNNSLVVRYLNITQLSAYRRDSHPMMYRFKDWKSKADPQSEDYDKKVQQMADCSHWCLPGLPDTWNRLLYASLLFHQNDDDYNNNNNSRYTTSNATTNSSEKDRRRR